MKTQPSRRHDGFTLVELLVVIAIIAVLAAAGFAAGNMAVQKAKKVKCLATATSLEAAIANFYSEYNYPPKVITADETVKTDTSTGSVQMLNALSGYTESASPPLNLRAVKFLTVREGKNRKDGLIITGSGAQTSAAGLYDPWGGPYNVLLDGDYDEVVTPKVSATKPPAQSQLNGRKSAVWSNGADGVKGGGTAGDDVITWQK